MNLPYQQRTVRDFYRGFRFEGDSVAVFGESTLRIFVDSGACRSDQVVVTGGPRFDVWRDLGNDGQAKDTITLLSYRDPDYFAPASFVEVLDRFTATANRLQGSPCRFVVKAKNKADARAIRRMMPAHSANLSVDHEVALPELFVRSRLIIGFNSLSVVEALLTDAQGAVPYWGDALLHPDWLMFHPDRPGDRDAVTFLTGRQELEEIIASAVLSSAGMQFDPAVRSAVVEKLIHVPREWTASDEVASWIRSQIDRFGSSREPSRAGQEERFSDSRGA